MVDLARWVPLFISRRSTEPITDFILLKTRRVLPARFSCSILIFSSILINSLTFGVLQTIFIDLFAPNRPCAPATDLAHFSLETFVIPMGVELSIYTPSLCIFVLLCVHAPRGLDRTCIFAPPTSVPSATKTFFPAALLHMRGNYFRLYLSPSARGPEVQHLNENRPTISPLRFTPESKAFSSLYTNAVSTALHLVFTVLWVCEETHDAEKLVFFHIFLFFVAAFISCKILKSRI